MNIDEFRDLLKAELAVIPQALGDPTNRVAARCKRLSARLDSGSAGALSATMEMFVSNKMEVADLRRMIADALHGADTVGKLLAHLNSAMAQRIAAKQGSILTFDNVCDDSEN